RRDFTKLVTLSTLAAGFSTVPALARKPAPQFSITMDDFHWQNAVKLTATERNQVILDTLRAHSIKAALFVIGRNIEEDEGKQLLSAWDKAGHVIANHTYSHRNFNAPATDVNAYGEDILQAEALLKQFPRFQKYFRFPMLKEGDTAAKRDAMRAFLHQHGYRNGHVTIDNSDWYIDQRLTARLKDNPAADVKPYRDYYLEHIWSRAMYYNALAHRVAGYQVKHTILVHFNLLNALFLGDAIAMFKSKGWQPIDAEAAFTDPVFESKPNVIPAGESIIWSLAKEKGTLAKSLRYPPEDSEYEAARMKKLGL
ncbi:MAG TPA: polysaccharide deacetylase family protein, partial [Pyrinomonadaceae bacterium]|nr:polysaccharide deacetylase family protein [Pyrinomonadaceae bacterium]